MTDEERKARIGELLRVRVLLADLLKRIDQRLDALGYEGGGEYEPPKVLMTSADIMEEGREGPEWVDCQLV